MARESCNLDKDEAEILKPSSSSSPSPSPSPSPPSPPAPSPPSSSPSSPPPSSVFLKPSKEIPSQRPERAETLAAEVTCLLKHEEESQAPVQFSNRCSCCRKRVGLTGFRCRCGDLFCAWHRYSDTHDCSFDYKAAGREEISKANPVIRAAKIIKI